MLDTCTNFAPNLGRLARPWFSPPLVVCLPTARGRKTGGDKKAAKAIDNLYRVLAHDISNNDLD